MSNGVDFRKLAMGLRDQLTEAESQLAALREELATAKRNEHNSEVAYKAAIEKQEELREERDAAEKRNAELESAVCCMLDDSSENAETGEITIMRCDYEALEILIGEPVDAALNKSEEAKS